MSAPMTGSAGGPRPNSFEARSVAESFGQEAARYARTRPSYPDALVERVVAASPGLGVLDVGTGTGIVARLFRDAGCTVTGLDVDPRMAEYARGEGFDVEVARFEDWEPTGRRFDAVVSGQAWHWVEPVGGAAKAAEVLAPGGQLAIFWNFFALDAAMSAAFAEVYGRVRPGLPFNPWAAATMDSYQAILARTVEGIQSAKAFSTPGQWRFDWVRPYTREQWLDQVPTHGGYSLISPDKLRELLDGLGAAIDSVGGSFTMRYTTVAVTAGKL